MTTRAAPRSRALTARSTRSQAATPPGRARGRRRRPPVLSEANSCSPRGRDRMMVVRDRVRGEPPHPARGTPDRGCSKTASCRALRDSAALPLWWATSTWHRAERAAVDGGGLRDIGRGRNGVLYAGEVNWEAADGRGPTARSNRPSSRRLRVVQVSKDPVGTRRTLTTQVSLAVATSFMCRVRRRPGSAANCPTQNAQRLKEILREVVPVQRGR